MSTSADPKPETFMRLFLANHRLIYAQVSALVYHAADADDVLQEVAIDMWQKFDQYDAGRDFGVWAQGFARIAALRYHERRRSQRKVAFDEQLVRSLCDEIAVVGEEVGARHEALRNCLSRLPDKSRRLIDLRYADGSSVPAIAQAVQSTAEAVYKALNRLHRGLLECVERFLAREGLR